MGSIKNHIEYGSNKSTKNSQKTGILGKSKRKALVLVDSGEMLILMLAVFRRSSAALRAWAGAGSRGTATRAGSCTSWTPRRSGGWPPSHTGTWTWWSTAEIKGSGLARNVQTGRCLTLDFASNSFWPENSSTSAPTICRILDTSHLIHPCTESLSFIHPCSGSWPAPVTTS